MGEQISDAAALSRISDFYCKIRREISVHEFIREFEALFPPLKKGNLVLDYRLGRNKLKRLRDEVAPMAHFLSQTTEKFDRVIFFLNSDIPDACLIRGTKRVDIEVSQVQATARYHLMQELNRSGIGRGFLPLSDEYPPKAFTDAMSHPHSAYSSDEYKEILQRSLARCLRRKACSERKGYLLIGAPIGEEYIPQSVISELTVNIPVSGFKKIILVDRDRLLQLS